MLYKLYDKKNDFFHLKYLRKSNTMGNQEPIQAVRKM
jgi:hypothetical protein